DAAERRATPGSEGCVMSEEGTPAVFIECVGGSHDGHTMPMHPLALTESTPLIVPPHQTMLAMIDAPEREPVTGAPDNTWERYLMRARGDGWVLEFDGRLRDLDPPAPPPWGDV